MLTSIQMARALACLMVLFSHAAAIMALPKYFGVTLFNGSLRIGDTGVDLFFVLSGFIIFFIHFRDINNIEKIGYFIYKRFTRIYPTYWVYVSGLTLLVIFGVFGHNQHFNLYDVLDFLTLVDISPTRNPLPVAWSLYYEVFFYALFSLLILNKRVGSIIIAIITCLIFIRIAIDTFNGQFIPLWNDVTNVYFLVIEFYAGFFAWFFYRKISIFGAKIVTVCGISSIVITTVVVDLLIGRDYWPPLRLLYGVSFGFLVCGLVSLEVNHKLRFLSTSLLLTGEASYTIYLVHFPLLSLLCKISMSFSFIKDGNPYLSFFVLSITTFFISLGLYWIVERPLLGLFRRKVPQVQI